MFKSPIFQSVRRAGSRLLVLGTVAAVALFDGGSGLWRMPGNGATVHSGVQAANADHTSLRLLKRVVPGADSFSEKGGEPPVYRAFRTDKDSGEKTLMGYAFVTPDFPPEPNGYSGPIDTLVGMDLNGNIVGVRVIYYKESLRYTIGDFFSWGFEEQFAGMRASDRFQVDKDIDGIAKATISAKAAARGIRKAVRAVTDAYIR